MVLLFEESTMRFVGLAPITLGSYILIVLSVDAWRVYQQVFRGKR